MPFSQDAELATYDCRINRQRFDNVQASVTHIYMPFWLQWGLTVQEIGIKGSYIYAHTYKPIIYDTTEFFLVWTGWSCYLAFYPFAS